eukprot:TRINITY_DN7056_c0_g1_i1.p1 TRINITY_DN7056_c0_g1~~TRINITY_DN7056_c0_g1_i1.p1  ORF type:complete len:185 (-),score=33.30 TRINITY_DN7056_c0_g1_i1:118-672(-)
MTFLRMAARNQHMAHVQLGDRQVVVRADTLEAAKIKLNENSPKYDVQDIQVVNKDTNEFFETDEECLRASSAIVVADDQERKMPTIPLKEAVDTTRQASAALQELVDNSLQATCSLGDRQVSIHADSDATSAARHYFSYLVSSAGTVELSGVEVHHLPSTLQRQPVELYWSGRCLPNGGSSIQG